MSGSARAAVVLALVSLIAVGCKSSRQETPRESPGQWVFRGDVRKTAPAPTDPSAAAEASVDARCPAASARRSRRTALAVPGRLILFGGAPPVDDSKPPTPPAVTSDASSALPPLHRAGSRSARYRALPRTPGGGVDMRRALEVLEPPDRRPKLSSSASARATLLAARCAAAIGYCAEIVEVMTGAEYGDAARGCVGRVPQCPSSKRRPGLCCPGRCRSALRVGARTREDFFAEIPAVLREAGCVEDLSTASAGSRPRRPRDLTSIPIRGAPYAGSLALGPPHAKVWLLPRCPAAGRRCNDAHVDLPGSRVHRILPVDLAGKALAYVPGTSPRLPTALDVSGMRWPSLLIESGEGPQREVLIVSLRGRKPSRVLRVPLAGRSPKRIDRIELSRGARAAADVTVRGSLLSPEGCSGSQPFERRYSPVITSALKYRAGRIQLGKCPD